MLLQVLRIVGDRLSRSSAKTQSFDDSASSWIAISRKVSALKAILTGHLRSVQMPFTCIA